MRGVVDITNNFVGIGQGVLTALVSATELTWWKRHIACEPPKPIDK
jgi:hypothetical protein